MFKLLLFLFLLGVSAGPALAQSSSKAADPDARLKVGNKGTKHLANNKATFHKEHHRTGLDLHIHDPTQFHTAQANRKYTYGKPGRNRKAKQAKKPLIKLGGKAKGAGGRHGHRTTG